MMIAKSADTERLLTDRLFEPDIARSKRGKPRADRAGRLQGWVWEKLTYYL